ncbi:AsnC family transcriptional regulator [Candidatus Endobugula sertula]|uniref:Leucine-responsive regulatory protein n=1 Tax=Candidatus Endobugula sertula TaxID=62101 RepID=A0A1D2QTN8_9GAMM|nr:AsnC family transcriptional regulator [Candidatus Endobugula sertula]
MSIHELDKLDKKILRELQLNGRISNVDLAKCVGLSATPCLNRVKRLESVGCIEHYTVRVNPHFVNASLLVFVEIRLDRTSRDVFNNFRRAVLKLLEIMECHLISGDFDYLLKARVSDMHAYRKLLGETLLSLPHVNSTRTYMVMEEVKETDVIPIPD